MSVYGLKDLSVRWKLTVGFGVVLFLTAVVGFVAVAGISATLDRVDKADDVNRIIKLLQDARMAEKNYIERSDDAEVQEFNGLLRDVLTQAKDLKDNRFDDEQNIQLMKALIQQTTQYQSQFERYVGMKQEREQVIEEMRQKAQAVLDHLDQMRELLHHKVTRELTSEGATTVVLRDVGLAEDANKVIRWMLQARSDEKNFLVFGGAQYASAVETAIAKIQAELTELDADINSTTRSAAVREAAAAIGDYHTAFERFVELDRESTQAKDGMIAEAREAIASAESARSDQKAQMLSISGSTHRNMFVLPLVALVLGMLSAWLIARSIVPRLQQAAEVAKLVAEGRLALEVPVGGRDEVGVVLNGLREMVRNLRQLVGDLQGSAMEVAAAAEQLSAVTVQTSEGVQRQRHEVEQVASAMHQMSASISDVAASAEQASNAAQDSDKTTSDGERLVSVSLQSIQELAKDIQASADMVSLVKDKSTNVTAVLDVIKGIAEQTNLLALNAAIEAARAGEQGRGFAVVASEVRSLAQRTQQSTTEIEALLEELQSGVGQAVTSMEQNRKRAESSVEHSAQVVNALQRISGAVATIVSMNLQIASGATEQSAVAEDINSSVQRINTIADQSASGSDEVSRSSEELARLGHQLQSMTERFELS